MNITQMANNLSPEIYENLKTAVETGKWTDGTELNEAQKQQTLQLVMVYQSQVLKSQQHFSVGSDGQIVNRDKNYLKNQFKQDAEQPIEAAPDIARFNHDDI
jgi:uncharacterized protein YeaC (DUF1315 family)